MRGTDSSVSKDPIETLTRRARRAWRQSERQIVAEHRNDVASRLRQLATLQLPLQATSKPEAAPSAIVSLTFPDWQILIADVALKPRIALAAAAKAHRLRLSDAGRYGQFWWLSISNSHGIRVVLLGSHLQLNAMGNSPDTDDTPPPQRQLAGGGERPERDAGVSVRKTMAVSGGERDNDDGHGQSERPPPRFLCFTSSGPCCGSSCPASGFAF
jgi:hypothetical protein